MTAQIPLQRSIALRTVPGPCHRGRCVEPRKQCLRVKTYGSALSTAVARDDVLTTHPAQTPRVPPQLCEGLYTLRDRFERLKRSFVVRRSSFVKMRPAFAQPFAATRSPAGLGVLQVAASVKDTSYRFRATASRRRQHRKAHGTAARAYCAVEGELAVHRHLRHLSLQTSPPGTAEQLRARRLEASTASTP